MAEIHTRPDLHKSRRSRGKYADTTRNHRNTQVARVKRQQWICKFSDAIGPGHLAELYPVGTCFCFVFGFFVYYPGAFAPCTIPFCRFLSSEQYIQCCLGWDRAAMDYDANTVVEVVSGKAHHCGIRWLQMRVVRAMVQPSDCGHRGSAS